MKILYFTNANLDLRRSHVYTILKTAEALAQTGFDVEVLSKKKKLSENDLFERHLLKKGLLNIRLSSEGFFNRLKLIKKPKGLESIFYFRDPHLLLYALWARKVGFKIFIEIHRGPRKMIERFLWFAARSLSTGEIFVTKSLQKELRGRLDKSIVAYGNTYDPRFFEPFEKLSKLELRKKLNLPESKKLLVYTGNTKTYSFTELLAGLREISEDIILVIVGATDEGFRKENDKVIFIKRVNNHEVPGYLLAADVLVNPYVSDEPGAFPFKLFEYMAAGRIIVAYANKATREVLNSNNAFLVESDNRRKWAEAIEKVFSNPEQSKLLAQKSKKDSLKYTRLGRGKIIGDFIKSHV